MTSYKVATLVNGQVKVSEVDVMYDDLHNEWIVDSKLGCGVYDATCETAGQAILRIFSARYTVLQVEKK